MKRTSDPNLDLSRRERQIMDVVFAMGRANASEVQEAMPDAPGYSSVRSLLNILVEKGRLVREREGLQYTYLPTADQQEVGRSELQRVLKTFFQGSLGSAVQTLIEAEDVELSDDELAKLSRLIDDAREGERP